MAKDPVLPLYYNDLTTSTQDWSDEEFGAYVRLLIHQWRQGGLPKDYQRLTRIATSLEKNWPLLKQKFKEVDGLLKNEYMEDVREKRAKHKQKQKENVEKRYQKSTKQSTKNIPLENEKEIEKEIENNKEKEFENSEPVYEVIEPQEPRTIVLHVEKVQEKIEEDLRYAFDEIYLDSQKMKWPHLDFDFEHRTFCEKVRGSPGHYKDHGTDGLRLAFQSQLRTSKNKKNEFKQTKQQRNTNSLIEGWAKRHGNG